MARRVLGSRWLHSWWGVALMGVPLATACESKQPNFARNTDDSEAASDEPTDPDDLDEAGASDDSESSNADTDGETDVDTEAESDTDTEAESDTTDGVTTTGGNTDTDTDESTDDDPEETDTSVDADEDTDEPSVTDPGETDTGTEETDTEAGDTDADAETDDTDADAETDDAEMTEGETDGTDEATDAGCLVDDDCARPLLCAAGGECVECLLEGEVRTGTTSCGLNGAGILQQQCVDGWWLDGTDCLDPDECENGAVTTCGAEFGSLGVCAPRSITCTDGMYSDASCAGGEEICAPDGLDEDCDGEVNEAPCEEYVQFAAANRHVCAVTSLGRVLCWGNNDFGQVASTNPGVQTTPTPVFGMTDVRSVAVGNQNGCSVFNDDSARCWGTNENGELGDGTSTSPGLGAIVVVDVVSDIRQVLPGANASCAVLNDGTVECWGRDVNPTVTEPISGLSNVVTADVAPGGDRFCAILQGGSVSCWGWNDDAAVAIAGVSGATQLGVGDTEACARLSSGSVVCWTSTTASSKGLTSVVAVDSGRDSSCAVLTDGSVRCWGDLHGTTPVQIDGVSNATSISVGDTFACVTHEDGTASCFGNNLNGQLGNPDTACCSLDVLETWFDPVPVHGP